MTRDSYEMQHNRPTRGNSFFGGNPQAQLGVALQKNNIEAFKKIVLSSDVDLEYVYEYPDYKKCIDTAVSDPEKEEFVKFLLENNVEVNGKNEKHGHRAPIHFAVENANINAVKALLNYEKTDVNALSDGNTTALLMAIKKIKEVADTKQELLYEIIRLLLEKGCNANTPDLKGFTAIYLASKQSLERVVRLIADYSKEPIDIDSYKDRKGKSARDFLNEAFPHLVDQFDQFGTEEVEIDVHKLFHFLSKEDEDSFVNGFKSIAEKNEVEPILLSDNGTNTLLQFATAGGMDKAVKILLEHGADPKLKLSGTDEAVDIACQYGFKDILKMFLIKESVVDLDHANSLLQIIIKGMRAYHKSPKADHKGCLEILLNNPKFENEINVNYADEKCNTALHYAARNGDQETVLALLKHGACIGLRNDFNEPPLADINAKTLEAYLDDCVTDNGGRPSDDNYEIHMNYRFLVYPNNSIENETCKEPLMNNNNIKKCDSILAPETDALLYMTRSQELRPLLKHPVITSFLYMKWQRISCLFYANITFYSLLWLSLILYIILGYGVEKKQTGSIEALNVVTHAGAVIGLILLVLREVFQLLVSTKKYVQSIENWMEVSLIFVTAAIVFNDSAAESTKQQLSAVAILLSSAELVLLIGQFPTLSTNIVMLKTVSWNFFKFLLWYCILIIAFALSFFTLFRQEENADQNAPNPNDTGKEDEEEDFFVDPGRSLFKTIVMLTGEFDAGSIKFSTFPVTSHIIFIVFVFMIPIVLFNLLNGLAVSDTQEIRANAELVGHISRIRLISYFESVLIGNGPYRSGRCSSWIKSYFPHLNIINPKQICMNIFARRISLFPTFIPQYKIVVKPNQHNEIKIPHAYETRKVRDDDDIEMGGGCCCQRCESYRLDPKIVKHSKAIISKKNTTTEYDEIKNKLKLLEGLIRDVLASK